MGLLTKVNISGLINEERRPGAERRGKGGSRMNSMMKLEGYSDCNRSRLAQLFAKSDMTITSAFVITSSSAYRFVTIVMPGLTPASTK